MRPFTQFFFWRTQAGAEVDLLLDRGTQRVAIEIKAGSARSVHLARSVAAASADFGSDQSWVLDQARGEEPLSAKVRRRNFAESFDWLPSVKH